MSTAPNLTVIKGGKARTQFGGPKVALLGEYGSGKTTAMTKLVDVGITPCIILLDDSRRLLTRAPSDVHYKFIKPMSKDTSFDWLRMAGEALKKDSASVRAGGGVGQTKFDQLAQIAATLQNFKCERCGEELGNAYEWGLDKALCIDGLTEMSEICVAHHVGDKPVLAQYDYGPPQRTLERFYRRLCLELECTVVMAAHPTEREQGTYLPKLIGRALGPSFGSCFDEVIYCYTEHGKDGEKYYWDTTSKRAKTKRRMMPEGEKLPVDWAQLFNNIPKRGGV